VLNSGSVAQLIIDMRLLLLVRDDQTVWVFRNTGKTGTCGWCVPIFGGLRHR
jgi:hypothetical protein